MYFLNKFDEYLLLKYKLIKWRLFSTQRVGAYLLMTVIYYGGALFEWGMSMKSIKLCLFTKLMIKWEEKIILDVYFIQAVACSFSRLRIHLSNTLVAGFSWINLSYSQNSIKFYQNPFGSRFCSNSHLFIHSNFIIFGNFEQKKYTNDLSDIHQKITSIPPKTKLICYNHVITEPRNFRLDFSMGLRSPWNPS